MRSIKQRRARWTVNRFWCGVNHSRPVAQAVISARPCAAYKNLKIMGLRKHRPLDSHREGRRYLIIIVNLPQQKAGFHYVTLSYVIGTLNIVVVIETDALFVSCTVILFCFVDSPTYYVLFFCCGSFLRDSKSFSRSLYFEIYCRFNS